jgi:hypothetical protein
MSRKFSTKQAQKKRVAFRVLHSKGRVMKDHSRTSGKFGPPSDIGCKKALTLMSAFIDSMTGPDEVEGEAHLATYAPCQRQLQAHSSVKNLLRSVEGPELPVDLALETRVRLSHERMPSSFTRTWARLEGWASDAIKSFAVPAVAGICSTLLLFGFVLENIAAYRDVPIIEPASTGIEITEPIQSRIDRFPPSLTQILYVEAHVDLNGKVVNYVVLSGPDDNRWWTAGWTICSSLRSSSRQRVVDSRSIRARSWGSRVYLLASA